MKIRFVHSIRFKIVALLLVLAIGPATFVYLVYSNVARRVIVDKYTQSAVQSVYETNKKIDKILNNVIDHTDVILTNQDFRDSVRSLAKYRSQDFKSLMGAFLISREEIAGLYVHSNYSGVSQYFGVSKTQAMDYINLLSLQKSHGEIVWLPTKTETIKILSGRFEKNYFTFARKIIDLDTMKPLGLLAVDLDESLLAGSNSEARDEQAILLFFTTPQGQIVSASDKQQIGKYLSEIPGMSTFVQLLQDQKTSQGYFTFDFQGKEMISIYSTSEVTGWKMVKIIPLGSLYAEISSLDRTMLSALIGFALLGMLIASIFSMFLTRPIIMLSNTMKAVEKGNLSARVKTTSQDELGKLGQSFNFMVEKMRELIEQVIQEERTKKELELEVLHAQINPHFLYNTLNTIAWMARIQDAPAISDAVVALIKLLRISINLGQETISLQDEVEYVQNYCLIQEFRFNNHFTVTYDIAPECLEVQIPKLILQPIVENAIVYGSENHTGNFLEIAIAAFVQDDVMLITVADNGPGMDEATLNHLIRKEENIEKFSKVGLNNVQQRLRLYFGPDYGIEVKSTLGSGTLVMIKVPMSERNIQQEK